MLAITKKISILLLFITVVAVSGSPWYLLAWVLKNNPIYPMNLVWRGNVIMQGVPDPVYNSNRFPGHHMPPDIVDALEDDKWGTIYRSIHLDPADHMGEDVKIGGYGAVLAVVGLPCLAYTLILSCTRRRWDMLTLIACFALSYAMFPFPTWARFALPILVPLVVAVGYALEALDAKVPGDLQ